MPDRCIWVLALGNCRSATDAPVLSARAKICHELEITIADRPRLTKTGIVAAMAIARTTWRQFWTHFQLRHTLTAAVVLFLWFNGGDCDEGTATAVEVAEFECRWAAGEITIDGAADESAWTSA